MQRLSHRLAFEITINDSKAVGAVAALMVHFTVAEDLLHDKEALPFASSEQKDAARSAGLKYFAVMHVVHSASKWEASRVVVLEDKM